MSAKRVALVGLGKWGKNILRELNGLTTVVYCCARSNKHEAWLKNNYPQIKFVTGFDQLLRDESLDTLVIATPIKTHFELAKKSLLANKHVFLEKPLATNSAKASELQSLAENQGRLLFTDHIFKHHPNFQLLKKTLESQQILKLETSWEKFGSFKEDILWNLVYHDLYLSFEILKIDHFEKIKTHFSGKNKVLLVATSGETQITININRLKFYKSKQLLVETKEQRYLWQGESLYTLTGSEKTIINQVRSNSLRSVLEEFLRSVDQQTGLNEPLAIEVIKTIEKLREN